MRKLVRTAIALFALFLTVGSRAEDVRSANGVPPPVPPGKARYIMVLRDAASTSRGKPAKGQDEEPDVTAIGGVEHHRRDDVRIITIPSQAAKQLRDHPRVAYLQRVWTGESLEDWDEATSGAGGMRMQSDSDTLLTWNTGTYLYDGSGNIKQIGSDWYRYDSAGRLIESVVAGLTETYSYDSFGNLLTKNVEGRAAVARPVDSNSNRLANESYDAAGNMITDGARPAGSPTTTPVAEYVYDSFSMMTEAVTRIAQDRRMIYTADDERIGVLVSDNDKRWVIRDFEGHVIREYYGYQGVDDWAWRQDYVYAQGKLIAGAREEYYGGIRHYHLDHLGSVRMITDKDGFMQSQHAFRPYGVEQTNASYEVTNFEGRDRPDPMKFTSHQRDWHGWLNVENDEYLDYMHARYYNPAAGRFLSPDPRLGNILVPQSLNRYAYVFDNPMNFTDPSGMSGAPDSDLLCDDSGCYITVSARDPLHDMFLGILSRQLASPVSDSIGRIKDTLCTAMPTGRTMGVSGGVGGVGAAIAGAEVVMNYNSGQISGFTYGGVQVGWNGVASASLYEGYVYGLNDSNSNYSGGFTGLTAAAGPGAFAAAGSGGMTSGGAGMIPTGPVKAFGASIGAGLVGGFSGGVSITNYSEPTQMGKLWGFAPKDRFWYTARQVLCK